MDVGSNATFRDHCVAEELVQLLIVGQGELNMARGNRELVLLLSGTASQLADLGRDVLYDGGHEHTSALAGSVGEAALLYQPVVAANREDQVELGVELGMGRVYELGMGTRAESATNGKLLTRSLLTRRATWQFWMKQ